LRDLHFAVDRRILLSSDSTVLNAEADATRACKALDAARARLAALEREKTQEDAAALVAAEHAEQQRRREWVTTNRPELPAELEAATQAEVALRAQPYVFDSPSGQAEMRVARARVQRAKVAFEQAAAKAPVPVLPADWASLTSEQQHDWLAQADQLATVAG